MKKLVFASVAILSLAAALPAAAQQSNPMPQQSSKAGSAQQNANAAASNIGQDQIMQAQQALNQKGFDVGKADGILGQRTKRALSKFQQDQGLQRTGRLDSRTLGALGLAKGQGAGHASTTGQGDNAANMTQPPSTMSKQPAAQNRLPANRQPSSSQNH